MAKAVHLGGSLAAAIVIGVVGGRWLDSWLGTEPWLFIAGTVLGVAGGFYQFFAALGKN